MDYMDVRQEIIRTCIWLAENKMVIGTWGNVSVRLDSNRIMLTPSRIDYYEMLPEDLVVIDYNGQKISGERSPTSEMHVHRLIYTRRDDVGAIVHCHPTYASAMCATGEGIPPILEEMSQMVGGEVPITSAYVPAGQHMALAEQVAETIGAKNAVLIRNHAPVCCGADLKEALVCCQLVEKAAACYVAIKEKFNIQVIPAEYVESERYRFLYKYGKEH
jgi:L-fuculose-phosphate aldolase